MNWTMGVWFVVGVLLGVMAGAIVWRRQRQQPEATSEQGAVNEESYLARIKQLEDALSKAETLVHEKAQRLHSAESQRTALHAQFEVTHARMTQFRELLAEATNKLKLEHNARRTAEEQVRGLDELVKVVQAQLVRMENERKQLSAALQDGGEPHLTKSQQAAPQLNEGDHSWQQRALLLQTSVHELKQANEELARKLGMTENKLVNRTYELRVAEEKLRSREFAPSNAF